MARMMTPGLELALSRAGKYADAGPIEPLHLLRGLLAEDQGLAARMLMDAGLNIERWHIRFPNDADLAIESPDVSTLTPSPALKSILEQAEHEPLGPTDEGSVSTDQVLNVLLTQSEAVVSLLRADGFDERRFRDAQPKQEPIKLDETIEFNPTPPSEAARIVDAAANRAREGLRVLEDFTRFVLNDAALSQELKEIRHALAAALEPISERVFLHARDTIHDVGVTLSTPREGHRADLHAVVHANAKRVQEAFRSVEEFGKILNPALGSAIETLRYRVYTLERALLFGQGARQRFEDALLYVLVTESFCRASLAGTVREAVEGGADVIQLREKSVSDRALLEMARDLRRITRDHGALLIINDRPDIARLCDADGVHLGQDDMTLSDARKIVGPDAFLGISTHSVGQARRALLEGASYLGVGPTFPSRTKDFNELAGLEFVHEIAEMTSLPAFVLGGVNIENVDDVLKAGGRRVAVSRAICDAEDPRRLAAEFKKKLLAAPNSPMSGAETV